MYRKIDYFSFIAPYHKPMFLSPLDILVCVYFNVSTAWLKKKEHNALVFIGLYFSLHECMECETCILSCSKTNFP